MKLSLGVSYNRMESIVLDEATPKYVQLESDESRMCSEMKK